MKFVDIEELAAEFEGDEDILDSVLKKFVGEIPNFLKELDGAAASNDAQAVAHAAHTFKGAISTFFVTAVVEQAQKIEIDAKGGNVSNVNEDLDTLRKLVEQAVPELEEICRVGLLKVVAS